MQVVGCRFSRTVATANRLFQLLTFLACACFMLPVGAQEHPAEHLVLVLHSYHEGFYWTDQLQHGIESEFSEQKIEAEFLIEHMDMKRFGNAEDLYPIFRDLFHKKYGNLQPELIISCDNDALEFLFQYRDEVFPDVPVVFCGLDVSDYDESRFEGRRGYTGVVEKIDLGSTIEIILKIQPQTKQIVFVHDLTDAGRSYRREAEAIEMDYANRVTFQYLGDEPGLSETELLQALEKLSPDSAVYFLGFFRDRQGQPLEPEHIVPLMCEHSPAPIFTFSDGLFFEGMVGGKMFTAEEHGRLTAQKSISLLNGKNIKDEPVYVGSSNCYVFDYRRLKEFNISHSLLPSDSRILNAPSSLLGKYAKVIFFIIGVLLILLILLGLLLVDMLRRLSIERKLAQTKSRYRLLAENATDMISSNKADGTFLYVSPSCCHMTGYQPDELVGRNAFDFFHTDDIESARTVLNAVLQDTEVHTARFRLRHKSGHYFWCECNARGIINSETDNVDTLLATTRDVNDRVLAEEERNRERDRATSYLNLVGNFVIALDRQGCVTLINPSGCEIIGQAREKIIGQSWFDNFIPENVRDDVKKGFRALIEGDIENIKSFENPVVTKTGEERIIAWHNALLYDDEDRISGTLSSGTDITENRQAENALKQSERFRRRVMESAPFGVLVFDVIRDGFDYINEPLQQIIGYNEQEIMADGRDVLNKVYHPEDNKRMERLIQDLQEDRHNRVFELEHRIVRKDGAVRWVYTKHVVLSRQQDNRPWQILAMVVDITDRVESEQERIELIRQIEEAKRSSSLATLAGGIAHDFNNIMQVILGNLEMIPFEMGNNPELNSMFTDLKASAQKAADLSQKMLDYSGHGVVMQDVNDISDLVSRGVDSCKDRAPRGVTISIEQDGNLAMVRGNPKQIEHAVSNLVENSLESIADRSGKVLVKLYKKALTDEDLRGSYTGKSLKHGEYVAVEVQDNGCGIKLSNFSRLFEPFYSTKFTGRGLGLPVVQGVMRGHNGAVFVQGKPGKGTSIQLLFPVKY